MSAPAEDDTGPDARTDPPTAGLRAASPVVRRLLLASAANSAGTGLFLAGSVVYFTRRVGLTPTQVGLGLSLAAVTGLLAAVPAGAVADRFGARGVLVALHLVRAAAFAAYPLVSGFWAFLAVVCVIGAADRSAPPASQALTASVVPVDRRVPTLALMRAVENIGFTVGAGTAALALTVQTRVAYDAIVLGNALSFLLTAAVVAGLPRPARAAGPAGRTGALRRLLREDRRYLRLTALDGVLALNAVVLVLGMPLWLLTRTDAPRWVVAALLLLNTVLVVALQVRAAAGVDSVPAGGRSLARGGLALGVACVLFAAAGAGGPLPLVLLLLVSGTAALTAGELWHAVGSWTASLGLAPEHARARYLAVFGLGVAGAEIVGPVLLTAGVIAHGPPGWLLLGALFAAAGLLAARTLADRGGPAAPPADG